LTGQHSDTTVATRRAFPLVAWLFREALF